MPYPNVTEFSIYEANPNILPEDRVEIHVSNPRLYEESAFSKYTVYMVHGEDIEGRFEAYRRYSDFLVLRNQLINRLPGCLVPPLPPKKIIGKFSDAFIESRRKMLSYFLRELVNHRHFYTSEEFNLFIRGAADYERISGEIKFDLHDILIGYQNICCFPTDIRLTDKMLFQLRDDEKFLRNSLDKLTILRRNVKLILNEFEIFKELYGNMNEKIKEIENRYIGEMRDKEDDIFFLQNKVPVQNPYKEFFDWIRMET